MIKLDIIGILGIDESVIASWISLDTTPTLPAQSSKQQECDYIFSEFLGSSCLQPVIEYP